MPNITWSLSDDGHSFSSDGVSGTAQKSFFHDVGCCNLSQYNSHLNYNNVILDLVFSNNEVLVLASSDPLVPEDPNHRALCISADFVQLHALSSSPYIKFVYNCGDFTAISNELDNIDWAKEFSIRSLQDAKYNNLCDYESFILLRERAKALEREMFTDYIARIEESIVKNPKAFWSYVKSKKQSNCYPAVFTYGQHSSGNGDEICNYFCDYFNSFCTILAAPLTAQVRTPG
ncbi:unnamed protein product [Leptosia nina]|uniref:Uncharacterized protein n=1 Tax=Leptosia nina TaxID=320188 RepID=A0AAV1K4Y9_9NEOP